MKFTLHHYFFLLVGFLFLGITSINLFSEGMFMDGVYYADISRNMAEGLGTFWKPHFTFGLYNEFYQHPPLAFGLQSIAFRIFGDSIYVERFYSLFTFIIVGYLIVLIWGKLTKDRKTGWIPLIFWISISAVSWSAANNILENTMSIFICLSVLFYLDSFEKRSCMWVTLSGLTLALALLTKGFVCLYIWGVPFFMWLFKREKSFLKLIIDTSLLVIMTVLPVIFLYFLVPDARFNMTRYFNNQVVGSIQNVSTVDSRFEIVFNFLENVLVPLVMALAIIVFFVARKTDRSTLKKNLKSFLMFLAIVLSGILPIMISMKQRGFYILSVYPFFAIGLAYYLYPLLKPSIQKINVRTKGFRIFKIVTRVIVVASIALSASQVNRIGLHRTMIEDCKVVIEEVGEDAMINICPEMFSIWRLHGYYSRYGNVSLIYKQEDVREYYLSRNNCNSKILNEFYEPVLLDTKEYYLYRRKDYEALQAPTT